MTIPFGHVVVRSGTRRVEALITPGVAKVTDGYAKHTVIAVEKRKSLLEYDGSDPRRMEVPILLDGFRSGVSQEGSIATLEALCMPANVRGGVPPRVIAEGTLPILGLEWAMQIAWGEDVIYDSRTGQRVRQDAVITLIEQSPIAILSPRAVKVGTLVWVAYTVRKGDTLAKLAARYSNTETGRQWYITQVRAKNGLRAGAKLPKVLKVPK